MKFMHNTGSYAISITRKKYLMHKFFLHIKILCGSFRLKYCLAFKQITEITRKINTIRKNRVGIYCGTFNIHSILNHFYHRACASDWNSYPAQHVDSWIFSWISTDFKVIQRYTYYVARYYTAEEHDSSDWVSIVLI
jgi:vancomycin permeability regulator SanA